MGDDIDWLDLPGRWTYGVCGDGRIFFIDDDTKSTSWVHPGTGYSIQSGHFSCAGLPRGWEVDTTLHGGLYFIKHSSDMSGKAGGKRPATVPSEPPNHAMVAEVAPERPGGRAPRSSRKGIAFGKRSNSMKRNPNAAVTKSGWLYKQASSGVKQWNKRWFVLVDRCLFYYKDEKEENILGSIPLLSFRVAAVQPSDNISRKHTFKVTVCWLEQLPAGNGQSLSPQAEHAGIRTYFFSAENTEEQESWIQAMGEAARVQIPPTQRHEKPDSENIPPSKHHQHQHQHQHCNAAHREHPRAEPDAKARGEGDGRGSEKTERKASERAEGRKEPLAKANGLAGQEPPSEPGSPRPGSTAFPPAGDGDGGAQRRGVAPRSQPEKAAQRKSSMTQLQQWVNSRRAAAPHEELRSPTRFYPVSRRVPDYYSPYSPHYPEEYQYYPPGVRPDSICSMPAFERLSPPWAPDDKRRSFRNGGPFRPAPAARTQGSYGRARLYSPVRSPSARFERLPPRGDELYAEPAAVVMRRSISSPKYDFLGDRRPVPAGVFPYRFPASPTIHDKMMSESETLITMVNRMVETSSPRAQLYMQVTPFPEPYRDPLQPYKISEQDTDKLLGKLCEQNKVLREQERLVQQLRAEKESLESALMGTHQELEMFGSQPAYPEKLLHKKESLQNQLINIRALANSTAEYESLESEVSTLHDDLWEQLNLDIQNEMLNRQIQKEIWRIQDVMEGLRKNNPSRGTDTAKHRGEAKSAVFATEAKLKMSVEEQMDRMKRHQSGSVREKRRSLQLPGPARHPRHKNPRLLQGAVHAGQGADPERYVELEPESPLSPEEMKEKQKKVERIKTLIAKSSLQNVIPLGEGEVDAPQDPEVQLQEQEKRIEISCALAAEASRRGRMLSGLGVGLVGFGLFFFLFGILLYFDSVLLAFGNLLFLTGLVFIIGFRRTFTFFFQRPKLKGTSFFLGGLIVVLLRWPILGMLLEAYGFISLFNSCRKWGDSGSMV
ncbi:hypothetical protein DUI87_23961 [Hirundo rustica rustica]|uniref:PH domain-containing protein n=2 Tax=Hirundo rustica rustica TaxID=333673 RepID=A0A3M0JEG5_HIRRU|nr:hypothetical protein DUI87_23961 [Hirundo rustica rustica]